MSNNPGHLKVDVSLLTYAAAPEMAVSHRLVQLRRNALTAACHADHPIENIMQIGPVKLGDMPYAAVDFHISDIVDDVAALSTSHPETGPATSAAQLKKAMWQCSSGVTSKTPFSWGTGSACTKRLQEPQQPHKPDAAMRTDKSDSEATQPGASNADPDMQRIWAKEAVSVSVWVRRYLEKRFF